MEALVVGVPGAEEEESPVDPEHDGGQASALPRPHHSLPAPTQQGGSIDTHITFLFKISFHLSKMQELICKSIAVQSLNSFREIAPIPTKHPLS